MPIHAQLSNNDILEFPDGTPDNIIDMAVKSHLNPPSTLDKVLDFVPHQAGLLTKAGIEGATSIPTMVANIPAATANATRYLGSLATGMEPSSPKMPYVNPFSEGADTLLGENAQPRNMAERLETDVARPLAGVGAGIKTGAEALQNGSKFIGNKLAALISSSPALQVESAIGGGAASGGTRELGGGEGAQLAAGILGGIAAPAAVNSIKGIQGIVAPFTDSGKESIVNNTLATYANDPKLAAQNIAAAPEYIPGSLPTSGTASGDFGLMGLEKTLQQEGPFAQRISDQNTARTNLMSKVSGSEKDIADALLARKTATEPLYQQAQQQILIPDPIKPVLSKIDQQIKVVGAESDAGKTLMDLKGKISGSLPSSKIVNTGLLDASGNPVTKTIDAPVQQSPLVQIYKETRDQLEKKGDQPGAYAATVKGVIKPLNKALGEALESQSPALKQANSQFRTLSEPVNKMTNAQEIGKKITSQQQDVNGNYFYSPAATSRLMKEGVINTENQGWQDLQKALSPDAYEGLANLQKDLARSNSLNAPTITPPGSNTFRNLASKNALSAATGGRLAADIPFLGRFYNSANDDIKERLVQAMLNKDRAAQGLLAGTPNAKDPLLEAILKNALKGAGAGGASAMINAGQNQ